MIENKFFFIFTYIFSMNVHGIFMMVSIVVLLWQNRFNFTIVSENIWSFKFLFLYFLRYVAPLCIWSSIFELLMIFKIKAVIDNFSFESSFKFQSEKTLFQSFSFDLFLVLTTISTAGVIFWFIYFFYSVHC